MVMLLKK